MAFQIKISLLLITCCALSITTLKASEVTEDDPNATTPQGAASAPEATVSKPANVVEETDKQMMGRVNRWLEAQGGTYVPVQAVLMGGRWKEIMD